MSLDENGMESFQYTALPARVVFGFGTLEKVAGELGSLGRNRAFVLSDPHHATALRRDLCASSATSLSTCRRMP